MRAGLKGPLASPSRIPNDSAASYGDKEGVLSCEIHGGHDVGDAGALCDQGGPFVDHGVVHAARSLVPVGAGQQENTAQARFKAPHFRDIEHFT